MARKGGIGRCARAIPAPFIGAHHGIEPFGMKIDKSDVVPGCAGPVKDGAANRGAEAIAPGMGMNHQKPHCP